MTKPTENISNFLIPHCAKKEVFRPCYVMWHQKNFKGRAYEAVWDPNMRHCYPHHIYHVVYHLWLTRTKIITHYKAVSDLQSVIWWSNLSWTIYDDITQCSHLITGYGFTRMRYFFFPGRVFHLLSITPLMHSSYMVAWFQRLSFWWNPSQRIQWWCKVVAEDKVCSWQKRKMKETHGRSSAWLKHTVAVINGGSVINWKYTTAAAAEVYRKSHWEGVDGKSWWQAKVGNGLIKKRWWW